MSDDDDLSWYADLIEEGIHIVADRFERIMLQI